MIVTANFPYKKGFLKLLQKSKSQIAQDLFVSRGGGVFNGFYCEIGACDGQIFSNTLMLEQNFGWKGILVEPNPYYYESLVKNRPGNFIELKCVWENSHTLLEFNQTDSPSLSTINLFTDNDDFSYLRKSGKIMYVESISLNDLLDKYKAPKIIDYLSIDTEGSEFKILESFDFHAYSFKYITVEHNFDLKKRADIYNLLNKHGYLRIYEKISYIDDWYVNIEFK
jgi:FkbM family methyltransferase